MCLIKYGYVCHSVEKYIYMYVLPIYMNLVK